jgi:hypothetical protein
MPSSVTSKRYRDSGMCVQCGKNPPSDARVRCEPCLVYQRLAVSKNNKATGRDVKRYRRLRALVFTHYGMACACCGESTSEFLTIDHVNNDGAEHRRAVRNGKGSLHNWLVANKFPDGFQTLCYNCNCAKYRYGLCPHQK